MKCNAVRQALWESIEGEAEVQPAIRRHVAECAACAEVAAQQARLHQLLNSWQPELELSPEFDLVLARRIRVAEDRGTGWLAAARRWLAAPVGWNASMSLASIGLLGMLGVAVLMHPARDARPAGGPATAQAGTVVRDLQVLDRDRDLIENFDLLSQETAPEPATRSEESQ